MLFVHDVHAVMGERELEFEDALRDAYAATVADDDTRLLWYFNSTHGAGEAYKVVTITARPRRRGVGAARRAACAAAI